MTKIAASFPKHPQQPKPPTSNMLKGFIYLIHLPHFCSCTQSVRFWCLLKQYFHPKFSKSPSVLPFSFPFTPAVCRSKGESGQNHALTRNLLSQECEVWLPNTASVFAPAHKLWLDLSTFSCEGLTGASCPASCSLTPQEQDRRMQDKRIKAERSVITPHWLNRLD